MNVILALYQWKVPSPSLSRVNRIDWWALLNSINRNGMFMMLYKPMIISAIHRWWLCRSLIIGCKQACTNLVTTLSAAIGLSCDAIATPSMKFHNCRLKENYIWMLSRAKVPLNNNIWIFQSFMALMNWYISRIFISHFAVQWYVELFIISIGLRWMPGYLDIW